MPTYLDEMTQNERDIDALPRIEAEAGAELPPLAKDTPRARAQRLLECDDPPRSDDLAICRRLAK